ncbi:MAG TPA: tail fiber domain-containing protein [Pyrinomonadaceae bacterium]|jgi:hypothetical protein
MSKNLIIGFVILVSILSFSTIALAQTSAFVYQGKLQDGAVAANGTYQFEFKLFDAAAGGNQIDNTISNLPATVTNGIFAVNLDFGAANFDGTPRFLEISVRLNGSNQPFTMLNPRQAVTSTPYAVRSLNANQATTANNSLNLGGVPANQYVVTTDPRMSDDRDPLPNSPNYIQNGTSQQANSNFNIAGEGAAKTFNTSEGYEINSAKVLNAPGTRNIFGGAGAGSSNIIGANNAFYGTEAGFSNTTGGSNSFFGDNAGRANTSALANSFFGANAGKLTTTGGANSFYGFNSGFNNTTGINNSFYGTSAGQSNSVGKNNVFAGFYAGYSNTIGLDNTFVGAEAGKQNGSAKYNTFVGARSGLTNTDGEGNSFFGVNSGLKNTIGDSNSFFGNNAGNGNTTGSSNSFFGYGSGFSNTTGSQNVFFGYNSGANNSTGKLNTFVAYQSGIANTTGEGNSFVGIFAGQNNTVGNYNSFMGYAAGGSNISGSYNIFIGKDTGAQNTTGNYNVFFGSQAGFNNTSGFQNVAVGYYSGISTTTGTNNIYVGFSSGEGNTVGTNNTALGANTEFTSNDLQYATVVGAGASVSTDSTVVLGRSADTVRVPGRLVLIGLGAAGSTALCRNASNQVSTCSSSARYKTNIQNFTGGLGVVNRLRPVTFEWKEDGKSDIGFVAEEVNAVEPLLTVYNERGEIEGVKYAQVTTALVNAVKEQQTQIEKQQEQIRQQQAQIDALKALVCQSNPNAAVCSK